MRRLKLIVDLERFVRSRDGHSIRAIPDICDPGVWHFQRTISASFLPNKDLEIEIGNLALTILRLVWYPGLQRFEAYCEADHAIDGEITTAAQLRKFYPGWSIGYLHPDCLDEEGEITSLRRRCAPPPSNKEIDAKIRAFNRRAAKFRKRGKSSRSSS